MPCTSLRHPPEPHFMDDPQICAFRRCKVGLLFMFFPSSAGYRRHLVIAMRHGSKEDLAQQPALAVNSCNDENLARDEPATRRMQGYVRPQKLDFVQPKSEVWRKNGDIA